MVYIRELPDSDFSSLPHDRYDIVTKDAVQKFPEDIRTKTLSLPSDIRSNLLVSQWVMSGLIHPYQAIASFIKGGIVQESSVYQHLVETADEEHYQRGARQSAIRSLFTVLEFRFDGQAVQALRPALENIKDLQLLQELHNEALRAENFEAFAHTLGMNGNEQ